jgi:hypothetical protein
VIKSRHCRWQRCSLLIAVLATVGCQSSDRVIVSGRITRRDGSPVVGSRVTFRSPSTGKWASGVTDGDGRYELGTTREGEGIPPGEYVVAVAENRGDWDRPKPRTIQGKYENLQTSGLSCTVDASGRAKFDFELEAPNAHGQ